MNHSLSFATNTQLNERLQAPDLVILILSPVNWCLSAPKGAQYVRMERIPMLITSLNIMACSRDSNRKTSGPQLEIPPRSDPRLSPESGYSSKMRFFLRPQSNDHPPRTSLLIFKHFSLSHPIFL
ncbi:hypothetical protein C8R43DRAFT_1143793 [Mycena crocata]|nr:hypothetical protein C8R43DRAFT_1143793 [Mycena crocata]